MNDNTKEIKFVIETVFNDNYSPKVYQSFKKLEVILAAIEFENYDDGNSND